MTLPKKKAHLHEVNKWASICMRSNSLHEWFGLWQTEPDLPQLHVHVWTQLSLAIMRLFYLFCIYCQGNKKKAWTARRFRLRLSKDVCFMQTTLTALHAHCQKHKCSSFGERWMVTHFIALWLMDSIIRIMNKSIRFIRLSW
jgi:hypothetical protein